MTRADSVFKVAEKYVNTPELTGRNDGALFDYWRAFYAPYANRMRVNGAKLPHCGFAVYGLFYEAGYRVKVKEWGRAYNYTQCKLVTSLGKAYSVGVAKLKPANVIIYKPLKRWFYSYHVGILKDTYPTYGTVYESNTSSSSSVYPIKVKRDGFYLKIRPYWVMWRAVDCLCDATPADLTKAKTLHQQYFKKPLQ